MKNLAIQEMLDQLPTKELEALLDTFLTPLTQRLPDERFRRTAHQIVGGVIGSRSPLLTAIAQSQSRDTGSVWAGARRGYRLWESERFTHRSLYKGLYEIARQAAERERPPRLVIALDLMNFEKRYTRKLEGVSAVHKATPPDRKGQVRLTPGYPAITASFAGSVRTFRRGRRSPILIFTPFHIISSLPISLPGLMGNHQIESKAGGLAGQTVALGGEMVPALGTASSPLRDEAPEGAG